jgi:hypothetical protein
MSSNKEIKSVAFNKANPEDQLLLKHVSKRNFSGYIKKLILDDMKKQDECKIADVLPIPEKHLTVAERLALLKSKKNGQ